MQMPSEAAMAVVEPFSWSSNVSRDGKLIGQQYVVAEAVDRALAAEREACAAIVEQAARSLICGRRRTNKTDRHVAQVLIANVMKIRARR